MYTKNSLVETLAYTSPSIPGDHLPHPVARPTRGQSSPESCHPNSGTYEVPELTMACKRDSTRLLLVYRILSPRRHTKPSTGSLPEGSLRFSRSVGAPSKPFSASQGACFYVANDPPWKTPNNIVNRVPRGPKVGGCAQLPPCTGLWKSATAVIETSRIVFYCASVKNIVSNNILKILDAGNRIKIL